MQNRLRKNWYQSIISQQAGILLTSGLIPLQGPIGPATAYLKLEFGQRTDRRDEGRRHCFQKDLVLVFVAIHEAQAYGARVVAWGGLNEDSVGHILSGPKSSSLGWFKGGLQQPGETGEGWDKLELGCDPSWPAHRRAYAERRNHSRHGRRPR
jgi:hypothetical protein